jgi:restriction endonuclease S subunit
LFVTSFKEVVGCRLDPSFISKITYINEQKPKYNFVQLKDVLKESPQYGANEEAIDGNPQKDVRYIRITDIDELGNLKSSSWKTANNIDEKYLLSYNDILFARSGSVGKCYIHKTELPAIFAGYLIRINVNKNVNPDFLFYYCCSKFYFYWVDMIQRPAVQANINSEEYKSLLIPLPPMDIQNRIVSEISNIRDRAKSLQTEALQILENAKSKVEKIILRE